MRFLEIELAGSGTVPYTPDMLVVSLLRDLLDLWRTRWRMLLLPAALSVILNLTMQGLKVWRSPEFLASLPRDLYLRIETPLLVVSFFFPFVWLIFFDGPLTSLVLTFFWNGAHRERLKLDRREWNHAAVSGILGGLILLLGVYLVVGGILGAIAWWRWKVVMRDAIDWYILILLGLPTLAAFVHRTLFPLFVLDGLQFGLRGFLVSLRSPWRWIGYSLLLDLVLTLPALPLFVLSFVIPRHAPTLSWLPPLLSAVFGATLSDPGLLVIYRRVRESDPIRS